MDRLYKESEVSAMTGIPRGTLRWWRSAGTGPPVVRIGSRVYYEAAVVEEWIRNHRQNPHHRGGAA